MIHAAGVCVATAVDDDEDEDASLLPSVKGRLAEPVAQLIDARGRSARKTKQCMGVGGREQMG